VPRDPVTLLRTEAPLAAVLATAILFWLFGDRWFSSFDNLPFLGLLTLWLFVVILVAAFAVVRHADALAEELGEPLGTLVLTLSVISIEVLMVTSVMLEGADNPELARDTVYATVMIVLNGVVGLCLLVGGIKHREQQYNLQGANAFLAVIIPLAVLALVMPNFTESVSGGRLSSVQEWFLVAACLGLYGVFLAEQTVRHRAYFIAGSYDAGMEPAAVHDRVGGSARAHGLLLLAYLVPVVTLAEELAIPLNHSIEELHAPTAFAGMLVAVLVVSPEALGALRGALANQLQRSVNIALGSAAATIGLTVPAVLLVCLYNEDPLLLGLTGTEMLLLLLTLLVSAVTFNSGGRTSVLQGVVHLVLFVAYVVMIFD
jgi:Ca2+:H+ antiporter